MSPTDRLREHPRERFSTPVRQFDLDEASRDLESEIGAGQHGHRQIALYRHGPATVALYHFEPGSELATHQTDSFVTIHVLDGDLKVDADGTEYRLTGGSLLTLSPSVPHSVKALSRSRMLLTICKE